MEHRRSRCHPVLIIQNQERNTRRSGREAAAAAEEEEERQKKNGGKEKKQEKLGGNAGNADIEFSMAVRSSAVQDSMGVRVTECPCARVPCVRLVHESPGEVCVLSLCW